MSLGSIVVDLKANAADFISNLSKASSAAKRAGSEIGDSFEQLGKIASSALEPFGELGETVGLTLEKVSEIASKAAESISEMPSSFGKLEAGVGALAGILGVVESAAIGLTLHAAESAAKLYELSESTGVSVEALSGLGFVAKQSGVNVDSMNIGLERLNKAMFQAATAPASTISAFQRLGISVKDSAGNLRGTEDVFSDIAGKFSQMQNGAAKTALAMEIFGRSGYELIPALNRGKEGIEALIATAQRLGIVLDDETAEAAEHFVGKMGEIEGAAKGLENQLMKGLLPALDAVATQITNGFQDKGSGTQRFIDDIVTLTKLTLALGQTFITAFSQLDLAVGAAMDDLTRFSATLGVAIEAGKRGDFGGIGQAFKDQFALATIAHKKFNEDSAKLWQDNKNFIDTLYGPRAPFTQPHSDKGGFSPDLTPTERDQSIAKIDKEVGALQRKAAAELELAAATGQSVAQQRLQAAQTEGQEVISKFKDDADEKLKNKKITVAEYQKILAELQKLGPQIQTAEAAIFVAKDLHDTADEFQKQNTAYEGEIAGIERLVAAYQQGGRAIADAQIDLELEKQHEKVLQAQQEYDLLSKTVGVTASQLAQAKVALDNITKAYDQQRSLLGAKEYKTLNLEIAKQTDAFRTQLPALEALNAAYFQNAQAQRDAQVGVKVADFKAQHPEIDDTQLKAYYQLEESKSAEAYQNTIAQEAARFDLLHSYELEVDRLNDVRGVLRSYGADTLAVDAAILDAQQKEIEGWDKVALKYGDVSDQFRAMANEIELQGDHLGEKVFGTFSKAIDDLSGQLAKFITTGKGNFLQFIQSIEQELIKAQLQKGFSLLFSRFLGGPQTTPPHGKSGVDNLPLGTPSAAFRSALNPPSESTITGLKPDGSESNPFYILFANGQTGLDSVDNKNFLGASPIDWSSRYAGVTGPSSSFDPYTALGQAPSSSAPASLGGINSLFGGLARATSSTGLGPIFSGLQGATGLSSQILKIYQLLNPASAVGAFGASGLDNLPLISASSLGDLSSFADSASIGADFASTAADAASAASDSSAFFDLADLGLFFSKGGPVKGPGTSSSDSVPAMLSNGEFVIKADAARNFGMHNLEIINRLSHSLPKMSGINFGGLRELGGDVMPGHAYIVGEKRPELFVPKTAGTILPSTKISGGDQQQVVYQTNIHVHGVTDADSFRKSQGQIASEGYRYAAMHHQRNRGT